MEVIVILDEDVMSFSRVRVSLKLDIGVGVLSIKVIIFFAIFFRLYIFIDRPIDAAFKDLASRELVFFSGLGPIAAH